MAHARALGLELHPDPGGLKRWGPTPADIATTQPCTAARAPIDPRGGNILVRTNTENARVADAMIARALEVNDLTGRAFEPDRGFAGQKWYDEMPLVADAECAIIDGYSVTAIHDAESTLAMRPDKLKLELRLYDDARNVVRTIPTDLGIAGPDDDVQKVAILVSKPTTLRVRELRDLLTDALFVSETPESALEELKQIQVKAEHRAATIIEGRDPADLRQLMRLVENEILWRLNRTLTDDEEMRWSLHRGRLHAEIMNRSTGETAERTMTLDGLRSD